MLVRYSNSVHIIGLVIILGLKTNFQFIRTHMTNMMGKSSFIISKALVFKEEERTVRLDAILYIIDKKSIEHYLNKPKGRVNDIKLVKN